jgi:hypothetical protein
MPVQGERASIRVYEVYFGCVLQGSQRHRASIVSLPEARSIN